MRKRSKLPEQGCYCDLNIYLAIATRWLPRTEQAAHREELRQHLELLTAALRTNGASEQEALSAALRKFGDPRRIGRDMAQACRRLQQKTAPTLRDALDQTLRGPAILLALSLGWALLMTEMAFCPCRSPFLAWLLAAVNPLCFTILLPVISIALPLRVGLRLSSARFGRHAQIAASAGAALIACLFLLEERLSPELAWLSWWQIGLLVYVGLALGCGARRLRQPASNAVELI